MLLFAYSRSDLWLDEALSVNIARLPLGDLRAALQRDGAPPLYYVLLHVWTGVLGSGDVAVRSLSAVLGVGTLVACWYAARRSFGTTAAWLAIVVIATNPFLIRYATEARMYMLEMLLVACGIIVVPRALERPTFGRLALVALVTALLVYTQYWAFYLVGVVAVALLVVAWRDVTQRRAALLVVGAIGVGLLTFIPWLPTFFSQRAHTGTPWGDPVLPGLPIGETFLGFAGGEEQEGWLLLLVLLPMLGLGLLGRAVDGRHLELDLRVQPSARWLALIGGATLVVGLTLSYLAGQAFEPRYSAIVFPFFALLVGRGLSTLVDPRVQVAVVAVIVGLGLVGGVRNVVEQRTQAGQVAQGARRRGAPGRSRRLLPRPARSRRAPAPAGWARRGDVSRSSGRRRSSTGSTTSAGSTRWTRRPSPTRWSRGPVRARSGTSRARATRTTTARAKRSPRAWRRRGRAPSESFRTRTTSRSRACNSSRRRHSEDSRRNADAAGRAPARAMPRARSWCRSCSHGCW